MRRLLVVVFTVLALIGQAVAASRAPSALAIGAADATEHAALHWHGTPHHHHADGSFHADDSGESLQHQLSDHAGLYLGLPQGATGGAVVPSGGDVPATVCRPAATPYLDGLLRPPRPLG